MLAESKNPENRSGSACDEPAQTGGVTDVHDTTNDLIPIVYDELRRLAAYRLSDEKPGQLFDSTALVDEAYLRLMKHPDVHWESKRHFFVAAAEAMHRILIENARGRKCKKRGGGWFRVDIDVADIGIVSPSENVLLIHEVMDELGRVDPESAELVKLRFFIGYTQQECADILGISKRTADNRWAFARSWLLHAIQDDG